MPWRNGLGTTVELAKDDLADGDGFAWRLSMADVTSDGEFSNFSGYDRCLLLLEGNGLTLDCAGSVERLEEPLQAARFRGEDPTFATLHNGPVKDFNIMTRRRYCSARVDSQAHPEATQIEVDADLLLVYAVDADLQVDSADSGPLLLPARHLLIIRQPVGKTLHCHGAKFIAAQIHLADSR
jgi:environmental stress-induced protein Ves